MLLAVEEYVTRQLRMFGLGEGAPVDAHGERLVGWGTPVTKGDESGVDVRFLPSLSSRTIADIALPSSQRESLLMPYLRTLSGFRDQVRQLAMSGAPASEILALSDRLRDIDLVDLGVALDDQDGAFLIFFVLFPPF